ncbi:hypothetical protein OG439_14675 [Amycolatopsis sp. NBC_01307]|uniref:hypothetical protein n=1 Tax=Amycolatopsis sp. NBC_01307 TaxID=2903561 RepID=UPI002E13C425|nr:hypothetical protein OG439_14675 [Amycolatopsis sp. NBC_01307]
MRVEHRDVLAQCHRVDEAQSTVVTAKLGPLHRRRPVLGHAVLHDLDALRAETPVAQRLPTVQEVWELLGAARPARPP